jgi:hypothetical protein
MSKTVAAMPEHNRRRSCLNSPTTIRASTQEAANAITTAHNLDFEVAPYESILNSVRDDIKRFRIGSCFGLWQSTRYTYDVIAITNENKGNGHFDDVFQWFENSCYRDQKDFRFMEVINPALRIHLTTKRGFKHERMDNYIKPWRKCKRGT